MDALVGLLNGVRAQGAFVLRLELEPPWSMRIQDEAPLTLICLSRGSAVLAPDTSEPIAIGPGDVVLTRGTERYVLADDRSTPPQVVVNPGQRCTTLAGEELRLAMSLGVRTWGNSPDGAMRAVVCAYEGRSAVSARLLDALPPIVALRAPDWDSPLPDLLAAEAVRDGAGQEAFLDRLVDLLLLDVLRTWFAMPGRAPGWWNAQVDPPVDRALRLIHNNPEHPWTVANLAAAVGCSRPAFARRFTEVVGEPPIAFLTSWRLALAADLLASPQATIASVARRVGYSNPFALSTAFKRAYGVSPATYRAAGSPDDLGDAPPRLPPPTSPRS